MNDRSDVLKWCDPWLVVSVIAIVIFGLIMLASASAAISQNQYGEPFHFLLRQLMYLMVGAILMAFILRMKVSAWEEWGIKLLFLSFFLLIAVLMPGIGHRVNGSARWVGFGPFELQVSEFVKLAVIVFVSGYLVRRREEIQTQWSGFLKPMALLGIFSILLLLEPDFGSVVVMTASMLVMMLMAGVPMRQFVVLIAGIAVVFVLLIVLEPYRMARVTEFLHPWLDPNGKGYQLTESLISFGRGRIFGAGLGESVQKLLYLPEANTDFIFSIITEELGLVGALAFMGLFIVFVWRLLCVGRSAHQISECFAAYIAYGIAIWFGMQFMVNVGVDMGALPTKGLTLPFVSYGGSSMVIDCMALGLIFRIDYETRLLKSSIQRRTQ